ncbi:MAG: zinc-ribbon domain-containing protein [Chloroflexi bacterium]|nr:zinc-ribbon domain-containing protein [Chloroflexota bacterium]
MVCPNCENKIPDKAKVCGYCGYKFKHAGVTQPRNTPATRSILGWAWGLGGALIVVIIGAILLFPELSLTPSAEEAPALPAAQPEPTTISFPPPTSIPPTESPTTPTTDTSSDIKVLIADHFDDPTSGWTTGSDKNHDGNYYDGGYRLSVFGTDSWHYIQYLQGDSRGNFNDFTLEFDLSSTSNSGFGGIVFRRSAPYNFYVFEVSPNGSFALHRADQASRETWKILIDWTSSRLIARGQTPNVLKVSVSGETISLYVNGQFLTSAQDGTYDSGWIGLFAARTPDDYRNGITAGYFFDNVRMTYP